MLVFTAQNKNTQIKKDETMAANNRGKLYMLTFFSGVLSISSYILLFTNQDWVIRHFTRGGIYALLPITTAFYFSVVHGLFTSNLIHLFGIRAATKPAPKNSKKEKVQP